jgi:CheY-like chemotaxis protein
VSAIDDARPAALAAGTAAVLAKPCSREELLASLLGVALRRAS